jgi:hypothetical protein
MSVRSSLAAASLACLLVASPVLAKGGHGRSSSSHTSGSSHSTPSGRVHVKGHTTKNGTDVPPHDRTAPNHTKKDNWSTKGNVNPETGKPGTKPPVP